MRKFIESVPKVGTNHLGKPCWEANIVQAFPGEEICERAMKKTEETFKAECIGCTGSLTIREAKMRGIRC